MIVLSDARRGEKPASKAGSKGLLFPCAARVAEAVANGRLSEEEAWSRYRVTPEAIAMWQRAREGVGLLCASH